MTINIQTDEVDDRWMISCSTSRDLCLICQEITDDDVVRLSCDCVARFHRTCIRESLGKKTKCPVCLTMLCAFGHGPKGEMCYRSLAGVVLPGYESDGVIEIKYTIPPGIQGPFHPHPGEPYRGTTRTAYLPNNKQGHQVLELLARAFHAGLVFTISPKSKHGEPPAVCWNGIHHKTSMDDGKFGYANDPTYLERVVTELRGKGIYG